jgi:diguanylate cyclase (GGDEF)-like protein/PAS domain S-box-containing protein
MNRSAQLILLTSAVAVGCLLFGAFIAPSGTVRTLVVLGVVFALGAFLLTARRARSLQRMLAGMASNVAAMSATPSTSLDDALQAIRDHLDSVTRTGQHLESVLNGMADAVFVVNPAGQIRESNAAATRLLGWEQTELCGKALVDLISVEQRPDFDLTRAAAESRDYIIETSTGAVMPASITGSRVAGSTDLIFVFHDITDRRRAERRVNYLAKHDSLTRLPNRMQFQHLLQQAIARAHRDHRTLALLYLDVDRFKEVNDTFGHAAGDRAIEVLSERLLRRLPPEAVIGRLAGDEFAVFLPLEGVDDRPVIAALARELLSDISRVFFLNDTEIYLTISIGIALCEPPADNTIELIRSADVAMYHAKQSGGGTYAFFDPDMSVAAVERLILKSKLRRSLELDELVTLYQPLVDLESGVIVGAEALLRWRLPGHGDIPPSEFIPLAEQSNLIHAIGEWVFRRVCTDYVAWRSAGTAPQRVAINWSLRQFGRPGTVDRIAALLKEYDVAPHTIELEITESTLMEYERSGPILEALSALGMRISIDDFGTGYSSLSALRQMPVQTIKIDQSFVHRLTERDEDATLVRTIVEMGRNLGLEVIAEGVETTEQRRLLALQGCHFGQGQLFGAPMTANAFMEALTASTQAAAPDFRFSA